MSAADAEALTAYFAQLEELLEQADFSRLEEAAWELLISLERLDRSLGVRPPGPDFQRYASNDDLVDAARARIDSLDSHLLRQQVAHAAIGNLLGAFEAACDAGNLAESIGRDVDNLISNLEREPQ